MQLMSSDFSAGGPGLRLLRVCIPVFGCDVRVSSFGRGRLVFIDCGRFCGWSDDAVEVLDPEEGIGSLGHLGRGWLCQQGGHRVHASAWEVKGGWAERRTQRFNLEAA